VNLNQSLGHIVVVRSMSHEIIALWLFFSYKELGLTSVPNKGDNGVHASASPFEGLAEKW